MDDLTEKALMVADKDAARADTYRARFDRLASVARRILYAEDPHDALDCFNGELGEAAEGDGTALVSRNVALIEALRPLVDAVTQAWDGSNSDGSERCPWCYADAHLDSEHHEAGSPVGSTLRHAADCPVDGWLSAAERALGDSAADREAVIVWASGLVVRAWKVGHETATGTKPDEEAMAALVLVAMSHFPDPPFAPPPPGDDNAR